jgi:hypothetical protein
MILWERGRQNLKLLSPAIRTAQQLLHRQYHALFGFGTLQKDKLLVLNKDSEEEEQFLFHDETDQKAIAEWEKSSEGPVRGLSIR